MQFYVRYIKSKDTPKTTIVISSVERVAIEKCDISMDRIEFAASYVPYVRLSMNLHS